jgi:hypothetical protein
MTHHVSARWLTGLLVPTVWLLALACGGDDDNGGSSSSSSTPSAEEQARYCQDVQRVSESLRDVRAALVSLDPAALQTAARDARAQIDALEFSAREGGGDASMVTDLRESIAELQRLLANPDLLPVLPQIMQQLAQIEADVEALADAGGCP